MNMSVPKIMSTDRVRQRFSEEQIRHLVERSLFKMSECPGQVTEWVSHYRTVYGEVTVVYAKEPHAAIVAYDDEMPEGVRAKAGDRRDPRLRLPAERRGMEEARPGHVASDGRRIQCPVAAARPQGRCRHQLRHAG